VGFPETIVPKVGRSWGKRRLKKKAERFPRKKFLQCQGEINERRTGDNDSNLCLFGYRGKFFERIKPKGEEEGRGATKRGG